VQPLAASSFPAGDDERNHRQHRYELGGRFQARLQRPKSIVASEYPTPCDTGPSPVTKPTAFYSATRMFDVFMIARAPFRRQAPGHRRWPRIALAIIRYKPNLRGHCYGFARAKRFPQLEAPTLYMHDAK